jgi:HD-GYP domain-containing protein (c-di-GMP phosphodiesterase class II)
VGRQRLSERLEGEEIPLVGRIVAIADVFDALTSARPYKEAWPVEKAVEHMEAQRDKHFEGRLVDLFFNRCPRCLKSRNAGQSDNQAQFRRSPRPTRRAITLTA